MTPQDLGTLSSEDRGRRSALRRRDQRRRGAARALHRRAPGAARRGRGADDLRARLRDVGQRAARRRRDDQRRARAPLPGRPRARRRSCSAGARTTVFDQRALARRRAGLARQRRPDEPRAACATSTANAGTYDFFIFFSYRYYHAYHGAARGRRRRPSWCRRPSATPRSAWRSSSRFSAGVRALMFNSPEERAMIQAVAGNARPAGGGRRRRLGRARATRRPTRFRQKFGIRGPFAIYVGRIDENKGCKELFEFFQRYLRERARPAVSSC